MQRKTLSIGVLASGSGTNLQAIIDAIEARRLDAEIRVVLCNRSGAGALERARRHAVPTELVDHKAFATREAFDRRVIEVLRDRGVELVCLAGFDRLISPLFVDAFRDRILNIHPALLPSFPGLHGQRQALEYGVRIAGCTVHFVDEKTDHGAIVIQAAVPVRDDDTAESLADRILVEEHRIYPEAIRLFAEGRLRIEGRKVRIQGEPAAEGSLANPRPRGPLQRTSR
ncbi:MAG: phosphoribosylglycinamide formyltransferase [Candidatus Binatia bacterium]